MGYEIRYLVTPLCTPFASRRGRSHDRRALSFGGKSRNVRRRGFAPRSRGRRRWRRSRRRSECGRRRKCGGRYGRRRRRRGCGGSCGSKFSGRCDTRHVFHSSDSGARWRVSGRSWSARVERRTQRPTCSRHHVEPALRPGDRRRQRRRRRCGHDHEYARRHAKRREQLVRPRHVGRLVAKFDESPQRAQRLQRPPGHGRGRCGRQRRFDRDAAAQHGP